MDILGAVKRSLVNEQENYLQDLDNDMESLKVSNMKRVVVLAYQDQELTTKDLKNYIQDLLTNHVNSNCS